MRQLFALSLVFAVAACGPAGSGSLGPAPSTLPSAAAQQPSSSPSSSASPAAEQTGALITIQVWLAYKGRVFATQRTKPATVATSRLALTELIAGPTALEREVGVGNAVTDSTTFDIRGIADGLATVSFSSGLFAGGRDVRRLRQAQVVYTLTQFSTVTRVQFLHANDPIEQPFRRADFADLLPQILVLQPVIGQRVTSPVTISGTADVNEATVSARILDAAGNEIATQFTTATCGSGCRGNYSMSVRYTKCTEQRGIVEVFEASTEDGTRVNEVRIPVILAAC